MFDWLFQREPENPSRIMTPFEVTVEVVTNVGVGVMAIILTVYLIRVWLQTDARRYPRWTMFATGTLFGGFAIRRILVLVTEAYDMPRVVFLWEIVLMFTTFIGMWGLIVLAKWVKIRTHRLVEDVTSLTHKLKDRDVRITELEAENTVLKSRLNLQGVNNGSGTDIVR